MSNSFIKCPSCNALNIVQTDVPFEHVTHVDYTTVLETSSLYTCEACSLLFAADPRERSEIIVRHIHSQEYAGTKQTSQVIAVKEFANAQSRSFLQSEILTPRIPKKDARVLDIGCFNAALLQELATRRPNATYVGFERRPHFEELFPKRDNFQFVCESLENLEGPFDLVILSHSLPYIADLHNLMAQVERVLAPEGTLFIQVPNIETNPCYMLMGDQYYFFSSVALHNFFITHGYQPEPIDTNWFPREIAFLGKRIPADATEKPPYIIINNALTNSLDYLHNISGKLLARPESELVVLGTTANAAFVHSVLKDKVAYFVDEDPSKIGGYFRGLPVHHPKKLSKQDTTLVPYGKSSVAITESLQKAYHGTFVAL